MPVPVPEVSPPLVPEEVASVLPEAVSVAIRRLSVGDRYRCQLDSEGNLYCEGENRRDQLKAPGGRFVAVSAGRYHTCGLRVDRGVACWGNEDLAAHPTGLVLSAVATADAFTCGLQRDGWVICWGNKVVTPPEEPFVELVTGSEHVAARRDDGTVVCFGESDAIFEDAYEEYGVHESDPPDVVACAEMAGVPTGQCHPGEQIPTGWTDAPMDLRATQLAAGVSHTCAVTTDRTVRRWGADGRGHDNRVWAGQTRVPDGLGDIAEVSAGAGHSCARRSDGTVRCWGDKGSPEGVFVEISSGADEACGLRADGSIHCW